MFKKIFLSLFLITANLSAEVLIEAIGYGKTVLEAQDSAIAELSGVIISNVSSIYTKKETSNAIKDEKEVNYSLAVTSKTILKGVTYQNLGMKNSEFISKAIFTRTALNDTMAYLKSKIDVSGAKLSRVELREKLEFIAFLKPLISYSNYQQEALNYISKKENEFLGYLNQGQIQFHVFPKGAEIDIKGKKFATFEPIFLSRGRYFYTVSKKGYFSESGYLKITNGEKLIKNISLIEDLATQNELFLETEDSEYSEYATEILMNYGIFTVPNKNHKFKLKIEVKKEFVAKVDIFKLYNLTVSAKLYKDGKIFETKTARVKNKQLSYLNSKSKLVTQKLVEALFSKGKIKQFFL